MADRIEMLGIAAFGRHGVLAEETTLGQRFTVDVSVEADLQPAGRSDDLHKTINYAQIAQIVMGLVEGKPFNLIEALAETIAQHVLALPLAERVSVTVHKPSAPVPAVLTDVSVTVTRPSEQGPAA